MGEEEKSMQIFVKVNTAVSSKTFTVDVKKSDTIAAMKRKLEKKCGIAPWFLGLSYRINVLEEVRTVGDYDIEKEAHLMAWVRPIFRCSKARTNIQDDDEDMQIFVKTQAKTFTLEVKKSDTIDVVKAKLREQVDMPPEQRQLHYHGTKLDIKLSVGDYNIKKGSVLLTSPWQPEPVSTCFSTATNILVKATYMMIDVQMETGPTTPLKVYENSTIATVKSMIPGEIPSNVSLHFRGQELDDKKRIRDYNIVCSSLIIGRRKTKIINALNVKKEELKVQRSKVFALEETNLRISGRSPLLKDPVYFRLIRDILEKELKSQREH